MCFFPVVNIFSIANCVIKSFDRSVLNFEMKEIEIWDFQFRYFLLRYFCELISKNPRFICRGFDIFLPRFVVDMKSEAKNIAPINYCLIFLREKKNLINNSRFFISFFPNCLSRVIVWSNFNWEIMNENFRKHILRFIRIKFIGQHVLSTSSGATVSS